MAYFSWNEKFSVSMELMDYQHQHMLNLLNKLDDAIHRKSDEDIVGMAITSLTTYAMVHFGSEESVLEACNYPDIDRQRREHRFFVQQVKEMEASHQGNNPLHLTSVLSFLRDWFIHHIIREDKKYAEFLSSHYASEAC